jgi:hypothetical protein
MKIWVGVTDEDWFTRGPWLEDPLVTLLRYLEEPLRALPHFEHAVAGEPGNIDFRYTWRWRNAWPASSKRPNRTKRKTQDGRRLRRYERRWIVERFAAGIRWQRRLVVRWEYHPVNFLAFLQLAALCVLLKHF